MLYTIDKPSHGSPEWLAARWKDEDGKAFISASVASAVHNKNPYKSPADLAIELLSDTPPEPIDVSDAMERGNRLEPVLVEWFGQREGITVETPNVMYVYESDDGAVRLIATLDGLTPEGIPVEIKTSRKMWDGELPSGWYYQGVQQAICTDSDRIEWGIFDGNLELIHYTQYVSSDEKQLHIDACREFLKAIDEGRIPETASLSYNNVISLYPSSQSKFKELDNSNVLELLDALATARRVKAEAEADEESAKTAIALLLGECDSGIVDGDVVVTWKTNRRSGFDQAKFKSEHPALAEKYVKVSEYRVMKINKRRT